MRRIPAPDQASDAAPPTTQATLTVVGDLIEDIVVWCESMVVGTDNPATVHRSRGGSAANVAALAAPSVPTRFIGRVGDDTAGRRLVDQLAAAGVDVRAQYGGDTGAIVVIVTPDGERTMFPDRAAAARLGPIAPEWLRDTAVLHLPAYGFLDGGSAAALVAAAGEVRGRGGAVSVDVSAISVIEELGPRPMFALLDELDATVLFANRHEAATLGLDERPPTGHRMYVVKDGPHPTTIVRANSPAERIAVPAVAGIRDTTGAGDAFAAGFLAAWMARGEPSAAVAAGHACAATVLAVPGAGQVELKHGASHA